MMMPIWTPLNGTYHQNQYFFPLEMKSDNLRGSVTKLSVPQRAISLHVHFTMLALRPHNKANDYRIDLFLNPLIDY